MSQENPNFEPDNIYPEDKIDLADWAEKQHELELEKMAGTLEAPSKKVELDGDEINDNLEDR